jgi:hypothetical protein
MGAGTGRENALALLFSGARISHPPAAPHNRAPPSDQYVEGNILLAHKPPNRSWNPRGAGRRNQAPQPDYQAWERRPQWQTGARIKITRNVLMFKDPEGLRKPLLDIGVGLAANMDNTRVEPVLRAKFGDLVSIKVGAAGGWRIGTAPPSPTRGGGGGGGVSELRLYFLFG